MSTTGLFGVILSELDIDVKATITKSGLSHALYMFLAEVKKKDGKPYPGKTLYELIVCVQKSLNQKDIPWKLIEDPEFLDVQTVLDNVMKERAR